MVNYIKSYTDQEESFVENKIITYSTESVGDNPKP